VKEDLSSVNNKSLFHYAARYNNIKIAKLACDPRYKIDIHMISKHEQRTALHIAVMGSRVEIVEIFLHHGARENKEDKTGVFVFEYITNCDIKNLFLRYGMRVTDAESMAEKKKINIRNCRPRIETDMFNTNKRYQCINENTPEGQA
jgi:ankyrin repeat protein